MDNSNMVNDERNNFYQKRTHHFVVDVFFRNVERLPTPVKRVYTGTQQTTIQMETRAANIVK
jgi:hypothetical protein